MGTEYGSVSNLQGDQRTYSYAVGISSVRNCFKNDFSPHQFLFVNDIFLATSANLDHYSSSHPHTPSPHICSMKRFSFSPCSFLLHHHVMPSSCHFPCSNAKVAKSCCQASSLCFHKE